MFLFHMIFHYFVPPVTGTQLASFEVRGFPSKLDACRFEWRAKRQDAVRSRKLIPVKAEPSYAVSICLWRFNMGCTTID